jgi:hypothetical protein
MPLKCISCDQVASGGHYVVDSQVIECPSCGGYRISGDAAQLLKLGTLPKPEPSAFASLVKRLRGNSINYPLVTADHLRSL